MMPLAHRQPVDPRDEGELVLRLAAGDESACEALYLTYRAPLWRFAYGYVRSREVAEELVQEVFLSLWRNRGDAGLRSCIRAWLYAAVRNHAMNHLRHERVVTRLSERSARLQATHTGADAGHAADAIAMGASEPDAQLTLEAHELDAAITRAIAVLPERRRLAMTLRWKHDLTPSEIARVLGTTPESVRVLLTRARQELALAIGIARA
jgi:RNA polymerase sigma-70 factor (ECF subfamily)